MMLITAGCSGVSFHGGDALKTMYSSRVDGLKTKYGTPENLEAAIIAARADARARNAFLSDFIFLIDTNYAFWAKNTYNRKAFTDFGADFSSTTLSTLSGIVTGGGVQGAKSLLSFISAGITTTRGQFSKSVLQDQNLIAIVAKTRALRAQRLIPLQDGMYVKVGKVVTVRPTAEYSVEQGMIDLAAYYEAGTFLAALQDITDRAAADRIQAQGTIDAIKDVPSLEAGLAEPVKPK